MFRRGPQFREWLLTKLVNAETACYRAEKFSKLEQRTRASLLSNLVEELTGKTAEFLGSAGPGSAAEQSNSKSESSGGIFRNVKKALAGRTRSQAVAAPQPDLAKQSSSNVIPKSKSSSSGLGGGGDEEGGGAGSQGRRSIVGGGAGRRGTHKSDSGRGSVGTGSTGRCSVSSSTGRGSSPVSSTSSPDLTNRLQNHQPGTESDTSSLNSMDCGPEQAQVRLSPKAELPASQSNTKIFK